MPSDDTETAQFQCPGQTYTISRSVHLGRLASFFPACRECHHRFDTGTLSARQVQQLTQTHTPRQSSEPFSRDHIDCASAGPHDDQATRNLAMATGASLRRLAADDTRRAVVVVGGHGRGRAAEWIGPWAEGLRWSGCDTIDVGLVTPGCLVTAAEHLRADGGVFLGGAPRESNRVAVSVWGQRARPLSAGHGLEEIIHQAQSNPSRPARRAGTTRRWSAEDVYLSGLQPLFHGLRPLRFVLHTTCLPLVRYLERLSSQVGCQPSIDTHPRGRSQSESFVAAKVRGRRAHFGISIDADGESCQTFDERGRTVSAGQLLLVLIHRTLSEDPSRVIVLENNTPESVGEAILDAGGSVVAAGATRAEMVEAMRAHAALFGGGSGRIWTAAPVPMADALKTLAQLLNVLSASDTSFSEVVEEGLRVANQDSSGQP